MSIYRINEGSFELPDGYIDQTLNVFPNSASVPSDFSVVMSRDLPFANEELADYFERQLKQLPDALPALKVLRRGTLTVGGRPAFEVEYTWINKGAKMRQRQVSLFAGGQVLNLTATAVEAAYPKFAAQFDALLASFKFQP